MSNEIKTYILKDYRLYIPAGRSVPSQKGTYTFQTSPLVEDLHFLATQDVTFGTPCHKLVRIDIEGRVLDQNEDGTDLVEIFNLDARYVTEEEIQGLLRLSTVKKLALEKYEAIAEATNLAEARHAKMELEEVLSAAYININDCEHLCEYIDAQIESHNDEVDQDELDAIIEEMMGR